MANDYEVHRKRVATRRRGLRQVLAQRFPEETRLSLEIGCGHGHWLVDYASEHPQKRCLGIDIAGGRIERALRKRQRAGIANVDFVKGEAMETLDSLPAHVSLGEVFVLFPDPWPKKRHWKNRLFCAVFLEQLAARCPAGTKCHFRTDHRNYFEWAEEEVARQALWRRDPSASWPFERETVFQLRADGFQSLIIVKH